MLSISKQAWEILKDKPCFAIKFCLMTLNKKKYQLKDAVEDNFGEKEEELYEGKRDWLIDYHKTELSDLMYFNGEYFEIKDLKFFCEDKVESSDFPHENVIKLFNKMKPNTLSEVTRWDVKSVRHKNLKARWSEMKKMVSAKNDRDVLIGFSRFFQYCFESDFLSNKKKLDGPFTVTFDWMIMPTNFQKIISGMYNGKPFEGGN